MLEIQFILATLAIFGSMLLLVLVAGVLDLCLGVRLLNSFHGVRRLSEMASLAVKLSWTRSKRLLKIAAQ